MSEETGRSVQESGTTGTGRRRLRSSFDGQRVRAQVVTAFAAVVRWVGTIAALILTAHVVLVFGGANPDNSITRFVADWANALALGFRDLFLKPESPKLEVLLNYGLAAVCWLVVTSVVVRVVRALG